MNQLSRQVRRLEKLAGVGAIYTACGLPLDSQLRDQALTEQGRTAARFYNYDDTPPPDDGQSIECEVCKMGTAIRINVEYSDAHVTFKHS